MLEDYEMDYGKPYTWLTWGGLILPEVVRNKDGSLMGFIRFGRDILAGNIRMDFPQGWALWLDVHHFVNTQDYIYIGDWGIKVKIPRPGMVMEVQRCQRSKSRNISSMC